MAKSGLSTAATRISLLLVVLLSPTSCGGKAGSDQDGYQVRLTADRRALIDGVLDYSKPGPLKVGGRSVFVVTLSGARVRPASPSPGRMTYPSPVPVGASVGVRLLCTGIDCSARSSERQNILTSDDKRSWTWILTAHRAGIAHVSVVATTYDQDTDEVLSETPPIDQSIAISATPSYVAHRIAVWGKLLVGLVGAGAIGTAARYLWRRFRKSAPKATKTAGRANTVESGPSTRAGGQASPWKPPR